MKSSSSPARTSWHATAKASRLRSRIRHYGFLANGDRSDTLARCQRLIALDAAATPDQPHAVVDPPASDQAPIPCDAARCPDCGGFIRRIALVPRAPCQTHPFFCDTS